MRFLLLLSEEDPDLWARADEAGRTALMEAHAAFDQAVSERGRVLVGEALEGVDAARTLRTRQGRRSFTEGPSSQSTEHLGGVYLIDVDGVETVERLVRLLPDHYAVEVRPAVPVPGYDDGDRA